MAGKGGSGVTTEAITITPPDSTDLATRGSAFVTKANAIEVTDGATYKEAGEFAVEMKGLVKTVEQRFEPACSAAYQAHRAMTRLRDEAKSPFEQAAAIVTRKQKDYRVEEERKARAEEARLQELARKDAEKRRAQEVRKAERRGDDETAVALKEAPVAVAPVVVARDIPKVEGQAARKIWKYKVIDPDIIPRQFLCLDTTKLGNYARSMKETASVPGVEFYPEVSL